MSRKRDKPDHELVEAFQAGDPKAFDGLVVRHQDMVFNLCYRMLGDYDDADDCAQETFVRVYRSLKGFKFKSAFSTWLYRVTVNTCKNRIASAGYRRERETVRINGWADPESDARPLEIRDCTYAPNGAFERREREEEVQRAMDTLPDDQRLVVVLRDIEGLSYEEISVISGLKLGTVKSNIARARRRLREKLKGLI